MFKKHAENVFHYVNEPNGISTFIWGYVLLLELFWCRHSLRNAHTCVTGC
jgi:hypothetical protein